MAELTFNPITGRFDLVGMTNAEAGAFLKLDQTTPQTVISGSPQFNEGLTIKENKRIYLDGI
jgi:hypothetical protein